MKPRLFGSCPRHFTQARPSLARACLFFRPALQAGSALPAEPSMAVAGCFFARLHAAGQFWQLTQFPKNLLQSEWWQRVLSFIAAPCCRMRMPAESHFASHSDWLPCTTSTPLEGLGSPPPTTSSKWWSRDIRQCCVATFGKCPNHLETAWLNNHDLDVFSVGTCNDASQLPPEFARAPKDNGPGTLRCPARL